MRRREGLSLLLSLAWLSACYAAERPLDADTQTNWLRCDTTSDCWPGNRCIAGQCAPPDPDALDTDEIATSRAALASSMLFEQDGIALSNGGLPTVGWEGDHGVVAWIDAPADSEPAINVLRVTPDGAPERQSAPYMPLGSQDALLLAGNGRIAAALGETTCKLAVLAPDLLSHSAEIPVPCDAEATQLAAFPVTGTQDWVVAFNSGAYDGPGGSYRGTVSVGRYSTDRERWSVPPQQLGADALDKRVGSFAAGDDAIVVWGGAEGTTLRVSSEMAREKLAAGARPLQWSEPSRVGAPTEAAVYSDLYQYRFADLGERRLLFSHEGSALFAYALARDGKARHRATVTDESNGLSSVAAAKELGLAGVCFSVDNTSAGAELKPGEHRVTFALLDANGRPVIEPLAFFSGEFAYAGCGVAWSGRQFFAVAWGLSLGGPVQVNMRGVLIGRSGR